MKIVYLIILFFSIASSFYLSSKFLFKKNHIEKSFGLLMTVEAIWLVGILFMLFSPDEKTAGIFYRIQFTAVAILPVILIIFVLNYTQYARIINNFLLIGLSIIPILSIINIWNNNILENLIFSKRDNLMVVFNWDALTWFYVHSLYSYSLILISILRLLLFMGRKKSLYKGQALCMGIGIILLSVFNVLYTLKILPPYFTMTPIGFAFFGVFLYTAFFQYQFLDIIPIARDLILDTMEEGIVILDKKYRIIDGNTSFTKLFNPQNKNMIGSHIDHLLAAYPDLINFIESNESGETNIEIMKDRDILCLNMKMVPVSPSSKYKKAKMLLFRDITKKVQEQEEREKLIGELQTALKEVKELSGMLPICANCKKIRDDRGYWNRIETYIEKNTDAVFTHGICPDCARELYDYDDPEEDSIS